MPASGPTAAPSCPAPSGSAVRFTSPRMLSTTPPTPPSASASAPSCRASGTRLPCKAAQQELDRLVSAYRGKADRLADWLEQNVPEGLAVLTLPEPHRRRMRTANPIERAIQQEIKRRTSKVRVFPNRDALLRLVSAVLIEIDEDWATSNRVYINRNNSDA